MGKNARDVLCLCVMVCRMSAPSQSYHPTILHESLYPRDIFYTRAAHSLLSLDQLSDAHNLDLTAEYMQTERWTNSTQSLDS